MIFNSSFPPINYSPNDTFSYTFHNGLLPDSRKNIPALIDGSTKETITYSQLLSHIESFAASLNLFMKRKQVLAIFSPNHIHYPIILHGSVRIGVTVTTANPAYLPHEFAHQLIDSKASVLFVHPEVLDVGLKAAAEAGLSTDRIFVLGNQKVGNYLSVLDLVKKGSHLAAKLPKTKFTVEQGRSKGVVTTYDNMVANMNQVLPFESFKEGESTLAVLPFYHIYALYFTLHVSLWHGMTIVVMSKFDLPEFCQLIQTYRIDYAFIVPPIVLALAKHPIVSKYNLSSLKFACSGAAPLGEEVSVEFYQRLKTTPLALYTRTDDIVIGSAGLLAPSMQAKIIDENGKDLGYDQRGELCLKGPNVMKGLMHLLILGYLNNPEATKTTLINGWLHTGDVAICKPNGHFFIVDRIKELIKYKGFQVVPAELEALLLSHPAVADSAVIPRPDERAGEIPKAYVVLKPNMKATEQEIYEFMKSKTSEIKWLRGGVEIIDAIPKSASGKILRRILRDLDKKNLAKL
ncbi:hypothetical protein HDV02_005245 [Globomyces sp. JEL0801]|nr:hypothetical protein HDV02_005245 [Globomyces sp. JEL0801]